MAESEDVEESRPRGSLEFVETSILDTIVPLESGLNLEEALAGSVERLDEGSGSPLASIPQRHALYFDETVSVYVVLQTPYFDERTLRSYLGRLVINLEAQVVNSHTETHETPAGQEVIYNGSVNDGQDPFIVVQGPADSGDNVNDGHILVVWKMAAFLVRPRLRLQNPSVVFSATANLKPAEQMQNDTLREEYLPSQIPSGINLLEAFSNDPAMGNIKPRLSALRVSRVAPVTQTARDLVRPLKNISRQSIKVYPAINARVRYSRPNVTPTNPSVVVSLDIDITPFSNCQIIISKVDMQINGGSIEDLNAISGMVLPMKSLPQDDITFLYRVIADDLDATNKSQIRLLDISIEAIARLSEKCQPKIAMHWTTSLDFTPPVNPGFGHPTQPIQRPHRPAQLSIGSSFDAIVAPPSLPLNHPDALPSVDITTRHSRNPSVADFGVTMTFTGPSDGTPIYPGVPFSWSVFIVNRSDRPRKLALVVIPKRRRTDARITRPPSTGYGKKDPKVADAVVDENIVYAMQRNSAVETTEIICLSTDTRVGPLAPSACYEVELKFTALKVGIVGIEAVRVVDLGTQEHVDIKDLPSIVEANKEKEEFFRQLYSLNEVSDDEDTSDGDELREILRKNRLLKPPSSSSFSIPLETSQERSQEKRRPQSQPPTITPLIHRTTSASVSMSSVSIVKETPLLRGRPSLLRNVFATQTPGVSCTETSEIESTPAERPQPERSASTPNIGSVVMTNSMGIASMLNKKPIVSKKRKRRSNEVKLVPEGERILADLIFFYIPNDEVAPLRRSRIGKALQYGATRAPGWISSITHVVAEKRFDYKEVMAYLTPIIKANSLPPTIILVNEDYPMDCIQFKRFLDPFQERYAVAAAESEDISGELPPDPPQFPQIKSGRPRKDLGAPTEQTPPGSQLAIRINPETEDDNPQQETWLPGGTISDEPQALGGQTQAIEEAPFYARHGDELDHIIEAALKVKHLPLDEDEDASRPSSSDGPTEPGSSEDEEARSRVKKPKRKAGKKGSLNQDSFSCMKGGTGVILASNPNKQTIKILEEMSEYYSRTRDEWRTRAYRQAVGVLKRQTKRISTYDEAYALPMIGDRLATKIEEIAMTNRLRRLDNTKQDPSDQALQIFTKIYNVGFATASRWVSAGYKTLDDLKAHANLTPKQLIGIEHYDDFNTRIPRDEVTRLGEIVQTAVESIDPKVTATIMGSYRRGASTSGDIDLMLTREGTTSSNELLPLLHTLVEKLTTQGFLVAALAESRNDGGSKWHGACVLPGNPTWRRIDFLLVPSSEMGAALIYFTGDDIFNRSIRLLASKKGLRLNQKGLFKDVLRGPGREKLNEGTLIEGADEKKIFEYLGVPWRPPEHRILH